MNILYMSPTREDNPLFKIIKYAFSKSKHNFTFFLIDYTKVKGWKWPFAKQFIIPSLIKYFKFDYIMLWDDDLDIHDFDVDIFLDICKAFKLEIAQPALSYNSYCSHQITLKHPDPNVSIRITDFVEIMCPVFTKEAWLKFYPYLQDNHEQGWGYDYMFKYIGKCGIIDSQAIQHTRKINPHGNHAGLEMRNFLNKYGIKQQYKGNLETFYINTMNSSKNLEITGSPQLIDWLKTQQISLALTTYQSSRLFLLGVKPNGNLSGFERLFDRAMGLYATPERLYMSSRYQLWQFDNVLAAGELDKGYDKLYVPRVAYTTGDLDIHDLVVDKNQNIIFVNTLYNCLATLSERHSFKPLWQPPFISKLVAEDRCHLNGLAMVDGEARYVTAISQSDVIDGWRERRHDGGCVIDIKANEIIAKGLSMPHSPRWYQGKLWLLNSGEGEFGYIENGKFKPLTFCPGYMRGLAFSGYFAIVALSKAREKTFTGLALDEKLAAKDVEARCGVMIIDLKTGEIAHWLRIEGIVTEFYDVQVLAGVQRAKALGFKTDEIQHLITVENDATERCRLHNARMRVCDWQNYDVELQRLIKQIELHIKNDNNVGLPILEFNALPIPSSLYTKVAQHMSRRMKGFYPPLYQRGVKGDLKKLRIGYISPYFRQHAVGRLIYPLFAAHNRELVEVFAYDLINADDELTKKIRAGCDVYVDLSKISNEAAAQRIHADGIHILIDLAGYTTHARPQILALQPAPIQVQFLGVPNTMGADFIQYLLADSWIIPEQLQEYYTEKVIYLPHAFVGAPLPIAERTMKRAEFGLSEDATVFCVNCINAHHKIDPTVFAAWMEILRQVSDSILWISDGAKTMRDNLQQAAASYNIAPERLVFAPKLPLPEYLARLALADLALDTFIYTGGSSSVTTLWAGLPLLTRVGETNASRMSASICAAAGLEQLICDNTETYIKRAVELVSQKPELATIRTILQKQREQLPLFDMKNFAQHLEAAYQKMWNLYE